VFWLPDSDRRGREAAAIAPRDPTEADVIFFPRRVATLRG
jgi:hypothetical protein